MPHAPPGLHAGAGRDHLVVGKQRAVEQHHIGFAQAPDNGGRELRRAGNEDETLSRAGDLDAHIGFGLGRERGVVAFEIERRLAGHQEQFGLQPAGQREALAGADCAPRHDVGRKHAEDRIGRERRQRRIGAVKGERPALAQGQQARGLVDFGAGEHHGGNRAVAQAARLQRRRSRGFAGAGRARR